MSLAIYAAPFDDNNNNDNNNDFINKKRQTHNKTQKKYSNENHDQAKVNSVLASIHQNSLSEDEDSLGDFNPPPPPQSAGVQKTKAIEENQHQPVSFNSGNNNNGSNISNMYKSLGKSPESLNSKDNNLDLNNFSTNYGDEKTTEDYYKKYLPGINNLARGDINKQYYPNRANQQDNNMAQMNNPNDILLQKINYMINLLEEQQDEKTNNVMEEVVLYSFLGVFIIFVVDSFARVGRYTR
jgi:hypothetical protein